jgi:hypothetical protein
MKKQAISAVIVLVILGSILSSCAAPPPPQADMVRPDEGTIGTEFTITGSGFGDSKPVISVGKASCNVIEWNDTAIRAVLADTIPAGKYDVSIKLGKGDAAPILLQQAFTVVSPYIDPIEPMPIWDKDKLTIQGSFFGSEAGKITVVDTKGQAAKCQVLEWKMESITFAFPEGLSDVYDITVQNEVGSDTQTRVLNAWVPLPGDGVPEPPPSLDINLYASPYPKGITAGGTHTAATGIFYAGKLWAFFPAEADPMAGKHRIQYRRLSDNKWREGGYLDPGGEKQLSSYAPSPVTLKGNLYVFWVDQKTSSIKYSKYMGASTTTGKDSWAGPVDLKATSSGEVSAVYNPQRDRLELYYIHGGKLYWRHTVKQKDQRDWDGKRWSSSSVISGVRTDTPVSAEAVQTGENEFQIMLAARDPDDAIQIIFTLDGKVTNSFSLREHTYFRPFLTNLGHGEIALLWRGTDNHVNIKYYSEEKKTFHDKETWTDKYKWHKPIDYPTAVVGFDVRDDALLATLWVFYARWSPGVFHVVYSRSYKYLGYWKHVPRPPDKEYYDWADLVEKEKEMWNLCPVVGVLDIPPIVLNGNTKPEDNKTRVTFKDQKGEKTTIEKTLQAGMYVKKEPELGLTLDVHAGITEQWSKSTTFTQAISYELLATDAPQVMVLYLAPAFQMIEYKWYNEAYQYTGDYIIVPVAKDASIIYRNVDPSTDPNFKIDEFPLHEVGNLDTYSAAPAAFEDKTNAIKVSATCEADHTTEISFAEEQEKLLGGGEYFKFSIGVNVLSWTGLGVEGEFELHQTYSSTTTDTVVISISVPHASMPGDIKGFTTSVYLAKPNADGFWVPLNRRGLGDEPWFITYKATYNPGDVIP